MQIRRAAPGDKDALIKLLIEFDKSTNDYLTEIQQQFRAYNKPLTDVVDETADLYLSATYINFVAEEENKLVGFSCGKIEKKELKQYNKEGYIEGWFVYPDYQKHGAGKQLFEALANALKEQGCTHLALDTHLANTKAIAIYEHLGFTKRLVTFFKLLK